MAFARQKKGVVKMTTEKQKSLIIYKATAPNGKAYIGKTNQSLDARRANHENSTLRGSGYPFHRAVRKYGDAIEWEVIARADSADELNALEAHYIAAQNTLAPNGYNFRTGGAGDKMSMAARAKMSAAAKARAARMTDEERAAFAAKMSEVVKGRKHSPEARANMSAAMKGKPKSAEARANMRIAQRARFAAMTDEERLAMAAKLKGKKLSDAHRAKVSAAHKERWATMPDEERAKIAAKISARLTGNVMPPEVRAKISATLKGKHTPCAMRAAA